MRSLWVRTLVLAVTAGATLTAAASAQGATATAVSPHGGNGFYTWPLAGKAPVLKPGTKLVVRVVRRARGGLATVALRRTNAEGRARKLVRSATLRRGAFTVRVPPDLGAHYELTLRAGSYRRVGRFSTAPAPGRKVAVPEPVEQPDGSEAPQPGPLDDCSGPAAAGTTAAAVLHLAATSATPGQEIPYSIENTGTQCLTIGLGYYWEKLDGGTWTAVGPPKAFPMIAFFLKPGSTWSGEGWSWSSIAATVNPEFTPGRYRVVTTANGADGIWFPLRTEIDVVAPAG